MWKSRRFHFDFKKKLLRGSSPFSQQNCNDAMARSSLSMSLTTTYRFDGRYSCVYRPTDPHVEEMLR